MDKNLALQILGENASSSKQDLEDALEQKLFELKSFLLNNVVVSKLWLKKGDRLKQLFEAAEVLEINSTNSIIESEAIQLNHESTAFLFEYNQLVSKGKLGLAQAMEPIAVLHWLNFLIAIEEVYYLWYAERFQAVFELNEERSFISNKGLDHNLLLSFNKPSQKFTEEEIELLLVEYNRVLNLKAIK